MDKNATTVKPLLMDTSRIRTPLIFGHLPYSDTSCIQTPPVFRHLSYSDTSRIRTPPVFGHLSYSDTSRIRTPPVFGHLPYSDTSLKQTLGLTCSQLHTNTTFLTSHIRTPLLSRHLVVFASHPLGINPPGSSCSRAENSIQWTNHHAGDKMYFNQSILSAG